MKKTISMLLASAITFSAAIPVFAADTFSDVNEKSYAWAYEYVEDMADKGLISGYEDGTFRPGKDVSRMEAFALFARLIGSNNEANREALAAAKEKYAAVLKDYELSYAEGDIAYMLYRGVLKEDELDTYFKGSKKSEAMPRHEAAVLITKAMLAEKAATSEVLIDMEYTDVSSIPKNARQYVYFVSQKGIMSGMGNGEFSPETPVLRSQIAVMMSKTIDAANYYFEETVVESIDTAAKNIEIKDFEGAIGYDENTKFFKNGEIVKDTDVKAGETVVLSYSEDDSSVKLVFVDVLDVAVVETVSMIYRGYSSSGGKLTVTLENSATGKLENYGCSPDVKVTVNDIPSDINKVRPDSYVSASIADGKVIEIVAIQKTETISGATIKELGQGGTITISHQDAAYDGQVYALASDVSIYKNGGTSEFSQLYRGDRVVLTVEYGIVKKIVANSDTSTVTGVIRSYTVSATPSLTIRKDGEDLTYDIPADVVITYNGQAAKLADFEIGSSVTLTIESNAVKKISATLSGGTATSSSITGVVTAVNETAKAIIISHSEGGAEVTTQLTCTNATRYYVVPTLKEYSLKQIKVGDTIVAYGDRSTGIFVCSGMTVTPSVE